ncbi:MAG: cysteine--tRNA ligase [Burkholderiaceae bacterium]
MLKIYNTLAREKQDFQPIVPGKVRMYVCGITVYDYCHVGHARMMMAFDVVRRWLRASDYEVNYVRNITDIDDKIIRRAVENNEPIAALTERFITAMHEDSDALGIARPDHEPRATDHVPEMLDMIEKLKTNQLAYASNDGDMNFSVRRFPNYGQLSGKSIDDLRTGDRASVVRDKEDPLDFVLWKKAKPEEPADAKWASPWGEGRPGWAIECSAMSCAILGKHFDIHGGGADLQFPHHENEIAQSEGVNGERFVNVWMHNGFLNVDNEKMSKSLGNFFTIRDVLKHYDAEVLRFLLLRTHYRSPLNYSDAHLDDARGALTRLYTALKNAPAEGQAIDWNEAHAARFRAAMDDDFNTPVAVAALFDLASEVNRTPSPALAAQLKGLAGVLGLLEREPQAFLRAMPASNDADESALEVRVADAIAARAAAKHERNYAEADRIRGELAADGVALEDTASGTVWRRA